MEKSCFAKVQKEVEVSTQNLAEANEESRRRNNFDVLRLVAATMVLVSHSAPLSGHREGGFPGTNDTLGFVAVLMFFSISGYLVTQSWQREPEPLAFARKRFRRIIPGLFVSLVGTAYVIGTLLTTLPIKKYLLSPVPMKFVALNLMQLTNYKLPGVFENNHSHGANGSLGTLPVEVKAYAMVLVLGMVAIAATKWLRVLWIVALVPVLAFSYGTGVKPAHTLTLLFLLFAGASAYQLMSEKVPLRWWLFVLAFSAWLGSYHLPFAAHIVIQALVFPYVVLFLAFRWLGPLRFLVKAGDVSYGMYIWAFPVQQTIVALHPQIGYLGLVAVALLFTYLISFISWHVIEKPFLRPRSKKLASTPHGGQ